MIRTYTWFLVTFRLIKGDRKIIKSVKKASNLNKIENCQQFIKSFMTYFENYNKMLQVVGAPNSDRLTLAVAEEIERAFGGWQPPPSPISDL